MASVYVQNKRGREEFWNGSFGLPEGKRMNIGHDSDLMALLDRIDNFDYIEKSAAMNDSVVVINELEEENQENQEERLNVVIKSLEEEIGFKQPNEENVACVDNVGPVEYGVDEKKEDVEEKLYNDAAATSVSEMAAQENLYYGDLGFFIDHPATSADELGIMIMSHCHSADHSIPSFYLDSLHGGFADNTEVFYGSLWEDDIWQLNDNGGFFQTGGSSSSTAQEHVLNSGAASQNVDDEIRPRQCSSPGEEEA